MGFGEGKGARTIERRPKLTFRQGESGGGKEGPCKRHISQPQIWERGKKRKRIVGGGGNEGELE